MDPSPLNHPRHSFQVDKTFHLSNWSLSGMDATNDKLRKNWLSECETGRAGCVCGECSWRFDVWTIHAQNYRRHWVTLHLQPYPRNTSKFINFLRIMTFWKFLAGLNILCFVFRQHFHGAKRKLKRNSFKVRAVMMASTVRCDVRMAHLLHTEHFPFTNQIRRKSFSSISQYLLTTYPSTLVVVRPTTACRRRCDMLSSGALCALRSIAMNWQSTKNYNWRKIYIQRKFPLLTSIGCHCCPSAHKNDWNG